MNDKITAHKEEGCNNNSESDDWMLRPSYQPPCYYAPSSDDCLPHLAMSNVSISLEQQQQDMTNSNCNSECVPVNGRLVDLSDNECDEEYIGDIISDDAAEEEEEGGIVILGESTEDEFEEAMRESSGSSSHRSCARSPVLPHSSNMNFITTRLDITQASMFVNDPIVLEAAERVNATQLLASPLIPTLENEYIDFEQLLREADPNNRQDAHVVNDDDDEGLSIDEMNTRNQSSTNDFFYFWRRKSNLTSSNEQRIESRLQSTFRATTNNASQLPVRATRIRHDKYVVTINIPITTINELSDIRQVVDIMGNMDLLHLWFDPVPAVFDSTIQDGGSDGPSSLSPIHSTNNGGGIDHIANNNNDNNIRTTTPRQYEGQWVEISTPPLRIPSDAHISGCFSAIRTTFRSILGFPPRIRSMIFVERSCGRMGMTLGPYPDGFLCTRSGTMAYHTFTVRISDDVNEVGDDGMRCIVISDEVRLQRGGVDDDFIGKTRTKTCCVCSILTIILGLLEWVLLFRWYRPDLASYMQQSCTSLEKLRSLVEQGGRVSGYHHNDGEIIMHGHDWHDDNDVTQTLRSPLLGSI
jgi:hypothetical protein